MINLSNKIMKLADIILTVICGEAAALIFGEFFAEYDPLHIIRWALLFVMPVLGITLLWLTDKIANKYKFATEMVKYLLVGIFSVLIDLKTFELLIWLVALEIPLVYGVSKGISFLISVCVKFVGNKYWVFQETANGRIKDEFIKFILVTFAGLLINVGGFLYFSKILGPQFNISADIWVKVSVILAAIAAAAWNFTSCKFLVFKKEKNDSPIPQI